MTDILVLRNQFDAYLTKSGEWLDAGDSKTLYRSLHRDEVINEKVELTVKHPDLRISLVKAIQEPNGRITIEGKDCLPKAAKPADDHTQQSTLKLENEENSTFDESSVQISTTNDEPDPSITT